MAGDGLSEETAWQITTPEHLKALADFVNAGNSAATDKKHYKIMNDLDLIDYTEGEGWNPIGNASTCAFYGTVYGNGKKILNLKINRPTKQSIGLFSQVFGQIFDLGIENCDVVGGVEVGSLCGSIQNDKVYISGCYATGKVKATMGMVGGLVGATKDVNRCIVWCFTNCTVIGNESVGGLVGSAFECTITNCAAVNESISTTSKGANTIHRLFGKIGTFTTCSNNYANSAMVVLVDEILITVTDGTDNEGIGKDLETFKNSIFYTTPSNWKGGGWSIANPTGTWKICNGEDMLPFLRWQGILCEGEIGITSTTLSNTITVYPNPTNGELRMEN